MKRFLVAWFTGVLMASIVMVAGAGADSLKPSKIAEGWPTWSKNYFQCNPMTVDELTKSYGKPSQIVKRDDGTEDYIYQKFEKNPMLPSARHFIVKDGKVQESFLKD